MKKSKSRGFNYYLTEDAKRNYQEKPFELRLKCLYMGNLLRKGFNPELIDLQNKFREGKI
ncbi:MAG: hypothetical protein HZC49_12890 [Nitrospirae bacterium]|nr:hypothetical protein [Nitrospirota bacterium]